MNRKRFRQSFLATLSLATVITGATYHAQETKSMSYPIGDGTITSVDGSNTYIDPSTGKMKVEIDVKGTNLGKVRPGDFRVEVGPYPNYPTEYSATDTEIVLTKEWTAPTFEKDFEIGLQINSNSDSPTSIDVPAPTLEPQTILYNTYVLSDYVKDNKLHISRLPDAPVVDASTIDGSRTKINSAGGVDVVVDIQGKNLNRLDKSKVKIKAGNYANPANVEISADNKSMTVSHTFAQNGITSQVFPISLVIDYGVVGKEQTISVKADPSTADEQNINDFMTSITLDSSNNMSIHAEDASKPVIDASSIDGSKTKINAAGGVDVVVEISGENLDKLDKSKIKIKAGKWANNSDVTVNGTGTLLIATHTFAQNVITAQVFPIALIIDYGVQGKEQTISVKALPTTAAEKKVGDYITSITLDGSNNMSINAKLDATPVIDASSIDGSKTKINAAGGVDVVVEISGQNLNKLDKSKIKIKAGKWANNSDVTVNADGTLLTAKHTFDQNNITAEVFPIALIIDYGVQGKEQTISVKAVPATADEKKVGDYITSITLDGSNNMSINAKLDATPVIDASSIDGSKTKINAAGGVDVVVEISGQNLNKLDKSKIKIKAGKWANNSDVTVNGTGTLLTATHTFDQNNITAEVFPIALIIDYGVVGKEQTISVKAVPATADEKKVGDYITSITLDASNNMSINAKLDATPVIDTSSIDGSKTKINTAGGVDVVVEISGQNLNKLDKTKIKIKAGKWANNSDVTVNGTGTLLTATHTFDQNNITAEVFPIALIIDYGVVGKEQTISVTADSATADEQTISGYITSITLDGSNKMSINAKKDVTPVVDTTSIDGSKTKINAAGGVDVVVEISGQNLNNLDASKVKIKAGSYANTSNITVNATGTLLTAKHTFPQTGITAQVFPIALVIGYGTDTEQTIKVTADSSTADEQTIGDYATSIMIDGSNYMSITAKPVDKNIDLVVSDQMNVPTYTQNETVGNSQLLADAGITATGDAPIVYSGSVSTATVGSQSTVIMAIEVGGDNQTQNITVNYKVKATSNPLVVSDQFITPTYGQNEEVTANQLLDDAGMDATGDEPIIFTGKVNTDTLGNATATLTATELGGDHEIKHFTVNYVVESTTIPLRYTDATKVPTYDQDTAVTAEQLLNDAGITYTGDAPIAITGTVDTSSVGTKLASITLTEQSGDGESVTIKVAYDVILTFKPLKATPLNKQPVVPIYSVGQMISPQQFIADSGISYSGDEPISITFDTGDFIDTNESSAATNFTTLRFEELGGDFQKMNQSYLYYVRDDQPDTVITKGSVVPTYQVGQEVTAEQLFKDSESSVKGVSPFEYTGTVDTSAIGDYSSNVTVTGGSSKTDSVNLPYHVVNSVQNADIISAIGSLDSAGLVGYVNINYTYQGDLDGVSMQVYDGDNMVQSKPVTAEVTNGNMQISPLTRGKTYEIRLVRNGQVLDTAEVTIPDKFIANDYFDTYSISNDDLHEFHDGNWVTLTNSDFDGLQNRGAYSKNKVDTSQPFRFNGQFSMDETWFPSGSGIAMMFYQAKDGMRNHTGDSAESLGLYENGSPFVEHGVAVSADMYNMDDSWGNGTHYAEIIDPRQGDSDNPYEIVRERAGHANRPGFLTNEAWKKFEIVWTPYENDPIYSGHLVANIGDPQGDKDSNRVVTVQSDITNDLFPHGDYWFKFDATTSGGLVANINSGVRVDGVDAAWVEPTATEKHNNEVFQSTYHAITKEEFEADAAKADKSNETPKISEEQLEELLANDK